MNASMTIIIFFSTFQEQELGLSPFQILLVNGGLAIPAAVGAYVFGRWTDRYGPKRSLLGATGLWIVTLLIMLVVEALPLFLVVAMLGGIALGGFTAAVRPQLIRLADPEKIGEYFGFLALMNKASTAIGPIIFGALVSGVSYAAGIVLLLAFVVAGMYLLTKIPAEINSQ